MKVTTQGHTKVIQIEEETIAEVMQNIMEQYQASFQNVNLVLDLLNAKEEVTEEALVSIEALAIEHLEEANKSFVIVTTAVNFNDFDGDLLVVPSKQEAFDLIEMDEIQRDLEE